MEKRQRDMVKIVVTLTVLSFVPVILAAFGGYDMGAWRIWMFPATFVVINLVLLYSAFGSRRK